MATKTVTVEPVSPPNTVFLITYADHGLSVGDRVTFSDCAAIDAQSTLYPDPFTPNILTGTHIVKEVISSSQFHIDIAYFVAFSAFSLPAQAEIEPNFGAKVQVFSGETYVRIYDPSHSVTIGDRVAFTERDFYNQDLWAYNSTIAECYEPALNQTYSVTNVSLDYYDVDVGQTPNNPPGDFTSNFINPTGVEYLLPGGLNTSVLGPGWGSGTWSRSGWNTAVQSLAGEGLRIWHVDNFGEDLIMNIRDFNNGVFYWDASGGFNSRAFPLNTYSGVKNAPEIATQVLVSEVDRHILCLGANPIFETQQDPMLIRWSSQEDPADWTPTATNTAGDIRLSQGSRIIVGQKTRRETLVFTDRALFSLQYIGAPYTFGTAQLADNIRIAGPNAVTAINDSVFWMGFENFFTYNGRVQPVPCSVRSYVFDNINREQLEKVYCSTISSENEIWWFYPSAVSDENDRYVTFNYVENLWTTGRMDRTAWVDGSSTLRKYPQATDPYGYIYNHEFGTARDFYDNGSSAFFTDAPLNAYIESSYFDIGEGDKLTLATKVLPDINMNASTTAVPNTQLSLKFVPYINQSDNFEDATSYLATLLYTDMLFILFHADQPKSWFVDNFNNQTSQLYFPPDVYLGTQIDGYFNLDFSHLGNPQKLASNIGGTNFGLDAVAGVTDFLAYLTTDVTPTTSYFNFERRAKIIQDLALSNTANLDIRVSGTQYKSPFFDGYLALGSATGAASHRNVSTQREIVSIDPYMGVKNIRGRGRHMQVRYDLVGSGTAATIGDTRVEIREDGKR